MIALDYQQGTVDSSGLSAGGQMIALDYQQGDS